MLNRPFQIRQRSGMVYCFGGGLLEETFLFNPQNSATLTHQNVISELCRTVLVKYCVDIL